MRYSMIHTLILTFILLLVVPPAVVAQDASFGDEISAEAVESEKTATVSDREGITNAVLDYIEGIYNDDPSRIERSIHPELSKLGIRPEEGGPEHYLHIMSFDDLVKMAGIPNQPDGEIPADAKREVEILDISDRVASARLQSTWGPELIHLSKQNGRWMVMHILWQDQPSAAANSDGE